MPAYRMKPVAGVSAYAFLAGSCRIRPRACGLHTGLADVDVRRAGLEAAVHVVGVRGDRQNDVSGSALRIVSVLASQLGLRTSLSVLPGW